MDRLIYDSKARSDYLEIRAPYYNAINPTTVVFENERISVFLNSLGHVEFFDDQEHSLGAVDVPAAKSADMYGHSGQYGNLWCKADGESVCIQLPVYDWRDHYPDCDGEYDRWSRFEISRFRVVLDCKTRQITILDR